MTPEDKAKYYKAIAWMSNNELVRRIKNFDFLIKKREKYIENTEWILANPEAARKKIEEARQRNESDKVRKGILYIRYKGLDDELRQTAGG